MVECHINIAGILEAFDLSNNYLEGTIPSDLAKLAGARITLNGNERM